MAKGRMAGWQGWVALLACVLLAAGAGWSASVAGWWAALRFCLAVAIPPAAVVYVATRKKSPAWLTFLAGLLAWALAGYGVWALLGLAG